MHASGGIGVVLILFLIIGGIIAIGEGFSDDGWRKGLFSLIGMGALVCLYMGGWIDGGKSGRVKGQIDALKGIQTHEIHYVYPKGDTIPSDTLYLKIK